MSADHRWSKFWWQDWQRDSALRMCSMGARGFWMELLCIAHEGDPYGHVVVNGRAPTPKQFGMIVGASEREVLGWLEELEGAGVFSRASDGAIYCRRMVRDKAVSDAGREHGKRGGNPALNGKSVHVEPLTGGVNPPPYPPELRVGVNRGPNLQEAEAESEDRKEQPLRVVARARGRPRPPAVVVEDWKPSEALVAFGTDRGLSLAAIAEAADKMRDWVRANGKRPKDWDATFRNWLRTDLERQRTQRKGWDQNPIGTLQRDWNLPSVVLPRHGEVVEEFGSMLLGIPGRSLQ